MRAASLLGLLLIGGLAAGDTPRTADELLSTAKEQAAGQKAIWAIFHASW
ncbi:MAG TPA: hypothetical protein VML19_33765 [Verrucomicrobiae bacterium]|nr:hypothetical protein [Verrucomicrobiae bacterium]